MPRRTTGVSTSTNNSLIIDAGAVYINLGLADERLLGATSGGNEFVVETEFRTPEIDSMYGPLMGSTRKVSAAARLTVNLIELNEDSFGLAIAGSDIVAESAPAAIVAGAPLGTAAAGSHMRITRRRKLTLADYIENIAIVGEVSGKTENIIIMLDNALALGNLELGFEDRGEVVLPVEFTAFYDPDDPLTEPWRIYYPTA